MTTNAFDGNIHQNKKIETKLDDVETSSQHIKHQLFLVISKTRGHKERRTLVNLSKLS